MNLLQKLLGIGIFTVVAFTFIAAYDSYKYLFWPRAEAVIRSIEPICVYSKRKGRRSTDRRRLSCNAADEGTKLVVDGYWTEAREAFIQAVYEAELGRRTHATLRPWWDDVATLGPGSVIRIRYSPWAPSEAELAKGPRKDLIVILGILVTGVAAGALLHRKQLLHRKRL